MITYKANVACSATDTPFRTLQSYYERGIIKPQPCDVAANGSGQNRGYSLRRLYQIAITTKLVSLGISASRAAEAAFMFSDRGNQGREVGEPYPLGRTFLVGQKRSFYHVICVDPDQSLDDVLPKDGAVFVIDCGKLAANVKSKLGINEKHNES